MLLVDYREGSKELVKPLKAMGLPVIEEELDADIVFTGRGQGGKMVDIGIEFKTLRECVGAMRTGRLQGVQVPRMGQSFDFKYLLVEGELLFNKRGQLMRRVSKRGQKPMPGQMTVSEFLGRTFTLHLIAGMNFLHTQNRTETLKYIETLYRTWTDQDLDKHKSHMAVYNPPTPVPVSDFRKAVMQWPGIGFKASLAVEKHFYGSIRLAVSAPVEAWAEIQMYGDDGKARRIGKAAAQRIVCFLEGRAQ